MKYSLNSLSLLALLIFLFPMTTPGYSQADSLWVDSVQKKLQEYQLESNQGESLFTLFELGKYYVRGGKYQQAVQPLEEARNTARELEADSLLAEINYHLGYISYLTSDYPTSLQYYSDILEIDSTKLPAILRTRILAQVSMVYLNLGEIEKSVNFQSKALSLMEATGDTSGFAYNLYLLAVTLYNQGDLDRSMVYTDSALTISKMIGWDIMIATALASKGNLHLEMGHFDDALFYTQRSLEYADSIEYQLGVAYSTQLLGGCYAKLSQSDTAQYFMERGLELHRELGYKMGEVGGLISLGQLQSDQGEYDNALETLNTALAEIDNFGMSRTTDDILLKLADVNFRANNLRDAFQYQKEHSRLQDSIFNEDVLKQIAQLTAIYEIRKMEDEKREAVRAETNRIYTYGSIILSILLLLLALVMYSRYRIQARANEMLNTKNEELARTNEELEQFAYVASHDLKEPLRMIGSYTGLLKRRYHDLFDEKAHSYMGFVEEGVKRMDELLKDLMIYAGLDEDTQPFKLTDIEEVVQGSLDTLKPTIEETKASINVNWLPRIKARPTQMAQLFLNLIANALKFRGDKAPEISIDSKETEDEVVFMVSDNGIGIDKNYQEKIFSIFQRLHQREQYEGTGIGLAICKKVAENHQGKIWVESTPGKGSTFFVSIPRNLQ
ncbi:MAG: ATP-binding protein [Bacteroidia bacterium]